MSSPPEPWKDITSFSQGTTDRTPRTWRAQFGVFDLVLTRHTHYAADAWLASCPGVFSDRKMDSREVYDAAAQAVAILQSKLENTLKEIDDHA